MDSKLEYLLPSLTSPLTEVVAKNLTNSKLGTGNDYIISFAIELDGHIMSMVEARVFTYVNIFSLTFLPSMSFAYKYEFKMGPGEERQIRGASLDGGYLWGIIINNYIKPNIDDIIDTYNENLIRYSLSNGTMDRNTTLTITRRPPEGENDIIIISNGYNNFKIFVYPNGVTEVLFGNANYYFPYTDIGRELYNLPPPTKPNDPVYNNIIAKILSYNNRRSLMY